MAKEKIDIPIPFGIEVDPMERLLLVNFEKDPDFTYVGFEPQVFMDAEEGPQHLIIGWRVDGRVDVYHGPLLSPDPAKYDITGKGLAQLVSVEWDEAFFEINDFGVQASYRFEDLYGRKIRIRIREKSRGKRRAFGLLAPMGSAAEMPSAMPLIFLQDFYFVRRKNTEFTVSVNGKVHQPDVLPLPLDWKKMFFTRYSSKPLIATLNPAQDGPVHTISAVPGAGKVKEGNYTYRLRWNRGKPGLKAIIRHNAVHDLHLRFKKPFPDLNTIRENAVFIGNFSLKGHHSTGRIGGKYMVEKAQGTVRIKLIPSKGWKPRHTKISLWFLYTVAGIFKNWPKTYEWTAKIKKCSDSTWYMRSGWERIK